MDRRQVLSKAMIGLGGIALASSATSVSSLNASGQCLNIKDFGAIGDGMENDTLAFKNALAELKIQGGGTLYIPATEKAFCIRACSH
ncbi:hypothetical protein [Agarilytica rhodophyticola]|uniref:hypothetical protein n=1 Tax=Agarilytica rhodophyticola TaxID=1737490 RepID=UPI000B341AB3|nr:hypothetical protein [Agarilytica rhodophyticola]